MSSALLGESRQCLSLCPAYDFQLALGRPDPVPGLLLCVNLLMRINGIVKGNMRNGDGTTEGGCYGIPIGVVV